MKSISFKNFSRLFFGLVMAGSLMAGCKSSEMNNATRATPLPNSAYDRANSNLRDSALPLNDEVWVISSSSLPVAYASSSPPGGTLLVASGLSKITMPLKRTHVRARIAAYIASVEVAQRFLNPYSSNIDAIYQFPLPQNAAVNDFIMSIGKRRIRGIIRERSVAETIFAAAKRQGFTASLLNQQGAGVFSQAVAGIEPGKPIEVRITYFHTLRTNDGWWEFGFPMSTDQSARSEFSLTLGINAGLPIEAYECNTHPIKASSPGPQKLEVSVAPTPEVVNKEFVFRYRVKGTPLDPAVAREAESNRDGLVAIWAQAKMAQLLQSSENPPDNATLEEIRKLALDYNLLSPFTAFLSVDSTRVNLQLNEPNEQ